MGVRLGMIPSPTKRALTACSANVYSQNGEDGITEKIFELIGTTTRICVEFGAWDGFHLSNTANCWTRGWKGVLIEGDVTRFRRLVHNVEGYDCHCVNAFVTRSGKHSLESILERSDVSGTIDLLSIDIDGDDYYILESLESIRPRVIICEHNPTIPSHIDLHAPYGSSFGASARALIRMAATKGYSLVAITETNCFFVLDALTDCFVDFETRLDCLKTDWHLVYLVTSYQGDYILCGRPPYGLGAPYKDPLIGPYEPLVGHGPIRVAVRRFKQLVRRLRRYGSSGGL